MSDVEPTTEEQLVSAYLDNEVTPAERARVEADPVLSALVSRFDTASKLMSGTVAAPADVRERSLTAALEAFDQQQKETATPGEGSNDTDGVPTPTDDQPVAPVVSLASVRRNRRLITVLGAAAATLVAVVGVSAFLPKDDGGGESTSAAFETADAVASDEAAEMDVIESEPARVAVTGDSDDAQISPRQRNSFLQEARDLATQPDTDAASEAFLSVLEVNTAAGSAAAQADSTKAGDGEEELAETDADAATPSLPRDPFVECLASYRAGGAVVPGVGTRATVQIGDADALVYEIIDADGQRERLVILDEATCRVLEERDL